MLLILLISENFTIKFYLNFIFDININSYLCINKQKRVNIVLGFNGLLKR